MSARETPNVEIDGGLDAPEVSSATPSSTGWTKLTKVLWWTARFLTALFLFVGALQLMKTGAAGLAILNNGGALVANAGATLGLGWIGALIVLSGSPVAASSLTLVASDSLNETEGFTMLTGSRLGAAFVMLVVAVVYALRGGPGERRKPVSTAVMALSTTALIYLPAATLGLLLLRWQPFHSIDPVFPHQFADVIDLIYGPLLGRVEGLPGGLIFLAGLAFLLVSFKIIDSVMPSMDERTISSRRLLWLQGKWSMFGLGSLVALITMSVSVALTVLVPLISKKYVKREHIIPYVMGANITTLGDTMLAAFALNSPAAVRIVLAEVIVTTILSVIVLAFFYPQVRRIIFRFQRVVVRSKTRLAVFTAALFLMPGLVIGVSNLF